MIKQLNQDEIEAANGSVRHEHETRTEEKSYFRFFRNHRIEKSFLERKRDEWFNSQCEGSSYYDLIWAVSNELLHEYAISENFFNMKMLYFELAFFEKSMQNEFYSLLQESKRMELFDIRKHLHDDSDALVVIRCGEIDCEICSINDGMTLTIREAVKEMPIPPLKCSHNDGWCTCCYTADYSEG